MLIILVGFTYILCVTCATVSDINNSYVLAKVLFYKSADGDFAIANGPVPTIADLAIKDDLLSRIKDSRIKVVSIFNGSQDIPETVDLIKLIKDEQRPVFVAEVKPRLSRTIKDWWDNLWGINKKVARKRKSPDKSTSKEPSTASGDVYTTEEVSTTTATTPTTTTIPIETTTKSVRVTTKAVCKHCKTTKKNVNGGNTIKYDLEDPFSNSSLEPADYFIPNDVFYSIEKRCVNWSDACDVQTGGMLDMPAANFNYVNTRPKISPNGPKID